MPPSKGFLRGLRISGAALDVLVVLAVFLVAVWARTSNLHLAPVHWNAVGHLRGANEIASGIPVTVPPPFLYTSLANLLLALDLLLTSDLATLLKAWAVAGALAAPLCALAARRLGGTGAAAAVGLVMALAPTDSAIVMGLKSPYMISSFTALAALGLAEAAHRKAWGPPLLAAGASLATAMHLGIWPLGLCAVLVALALALRLPRWQSALSISASLATAAGLSAYLWIWDGQRLTVEVNRYRRRGAPMPQGSDPDLVALTMDGLNLSRWSATVLLGGLALCLLTLVALLLLRRRRPAADRWLKGAAPAVLGGALALALYAAGASHILWQGWADDYLQAHHLVALPPLLCLAAAGLPALLAPKALRWIPPALLCGLWAWERTVTSTQPISPGQIPVRPLYSELEALGAPIRADVRQRGREPQVFTWLPLDKGERHIISSAVLAEQARWGRDPSGDPLTCYLVSERAIPGAELLTQVETLLVQRDDGCQALKAHQDRLCDTGDDLRLRRRKRRLPGPNNDNVIPCAASSARTDSPPPPVAPPH